MHLKWDAQADILKEDLELEGKADLPVCLCTESTAECLYQELPYLY